MSIESDRLALTTDEKGYYLREWYDLEGMLDADRHEMAMKRVELERKRENGEMHRAIRKRRRYTRKARLDK